MGRVNEPPPSRVIRGSHPPLPPGILRGSHARRPFADRHDLAQLGLQVQRGAGACVVIAAWLLLARRIRAADAARRRVLLPLDVFGILALLTIPV